jgi:hypothetical protein
MLPLIYLKTTKSMEACSSSLMKTAVSFGGKKVVQAMEIFAFNKKKYETYVRTCGKGG